jgi:catechol 2,3-dioxygenase-like lactoylglutathione lyase family enzyme
MTARIKSITIDCADHVALADFWSKVTGFGEDPEYPNNPGDPAWAILSPDRQLILLFVPVPEPKTVKNRIHLDIVPQDRTRDEEVERLKALGATEIADHRRPGGSGWVVMADPEGNEFCVERSDAERAG